MFADGEPAALWLIHAVLWLSSKYKETWCSTRTESKHKNQEAPKANEPSAVLGGMNPSDGERIAAVKSYRMSFLD